MEQTGYPQAKKKKKNEVDLSLTSVIKTNSKWTKDLNVRPEIIKVLEESKGKITLY